MRKGRGRRRFAADVDAPSGQGGGGRVDGEWSRAEYEEHVRDEHSTYTWLLEPMVERAGFAIEEASYTDDGIFARYLATAI